MNPPLPANEELTEPFWAGSRHRQLVLQWCVDCQSTVHYPRYLCPRCAGDHLEWRLSLGIGVIDACSVVHTSAAGPWMPIPYVVAIVVVDGARLVTNLVGDPESFVVGQEVRVRWEPLDDGRALPWFEHS